MSCVLWGGANTSSRAATYITPVRPCLEVGAPRKAALVAMLCYAMLCCAMICYAMKCSAMPRYAMLC
eukprot:7199136-Pyramimonas_sp.AAC.1